MTLQEVYEALSASFDVHYGKAPVGTECPYLVFTEISHPNILADDKTYFKTTECQLTLVEAGAHDFELQASLETLLDGLDLPYTTDESWLPDEGVVETYYQIAVYGNTVDVDPES